MVYTQSFLVVKRGGGRKKSRPPSREKSVKCHFSVMVKVVGMVEDLEVRVKSNFDGKVILAAANSQTENSLSCISEDTVLQRREIMFHRYIALAWLPSDTKPHY